MATVGCVGAEMDVVYSMHAGQSRGGRMSGDAGALSEYEVILMKTDRIAVQVCSSG